MHSIKISQILCILLLVSQVHARDLKIQITQREHFQEVKFYGGFNEDFTFEENLFQLNDLRKLKDILFVIQRGFGGSVKDHKKLVKALREKCPQESCKIVTYLEGQCSSMCTTLFLSGDRRIVRDDTWANLAFHRTLIRIGHRRIPIQTVNSMVRYFSNFPDVDQSYLKKHKNRLFKQPNNRLSHVYGGDLLDAGFAHELIDIPKGDYENPMLIQTF